LTSSTILLPPPILALPRSEAKFNLWLDTDASDGQLGCCLLQGQPEGPALPLVYWSRTLNPAESNYYTTEKECLAIVLAVTHLRPYLEGKRFTARTDHHALRWDMNLADAQDCLARWRLRLAELDFRVEYSPGATHHAADGNSRLLHQPPEGDEIDLDSQALKPNTTLPIAELLTIAMPCLFERQCLEATLMHLEKRLTADPSVGYDSRGILGTRLPSGELELCIPASLAKEAPALYTRPRTPRTARSQIGGPTRANRAQSHTLPHPRPSPTTPLRLLPDLNGVTGPNTLGVVLYVLGILV
jgi:hypothetical protein